MKGFQQRVAVWCDLVFGTKIANDKTLRNHRFIEEAIELVQSLGMTKQELLIQVNRTYNRPIGEAYQEIGGVMVTLAQLANVNNLDIEECRAKEFIRISDVQVMSEIKLKEATKTTSKNDLSYFELVIEEYNYDPKDNGNKAVKEDIALDSSTG